MENENNLTVSKRQASLIVALIILIGMGIFIFGYFLGKKAAANDFTEMVIGEIKERV